MHPSVLPYELIRAIFELAALDDPGTTFRLLLVSHATRKWLERRLYAKVSIEQEDDRDVFKRCMTVRNDDKFISGAVHQLCTEPNSDLLFICTNITHLTLCELDPHNHESYSLPSLQHLQNLKYLSLGLLVGDMSKDTLPPNITHLQFHDVVWSNALLLVQFAQNCPCLTHLMLDCDFDDIDDDMHGVNQFPDSLPDIMVTLRECRHVVITVLRRYSDHFDFSETVLSEIKRLQEQYYPQLILAGNDGQVDTFQYTMQCPEPLLWEFKFWDEMEGFLARIRDRNLATRSSPAPCLPPRLELLLTIVLVLCPIVHLFML